MKKGSDNFRESSILDIINYLKSKKVKLLIFDPSLKMSHFQNIKIEKDFDKFKTDCDLIIANRKDKFLQNVKTKIFSRDIYGIN